MKKKISSKQVQEEVYANYNCVETRARILNVIGIKQMSNVFK